VRIGDFCQAEKCSGFGTFQMIFESQSIGILPFELLQSKYLNSRHCGASRRAQWVLKSPSRYVIAVTFPPWVYLLKIANL
jgi:hypothetical protein